MSYRTANFPIENLPDEVLLRITEFMDVQTKFNFELVSKRLNSLVKCSWSQIEELSFRDIRSQKNHSAEVTLTNLDAAEKFWIPILSRCSPNFLQRVELKNVKLNLMKLVTNELVRFTNLTHLTIWYVSMVPNEYIFLSKFRNIEYFRFCPSNSYNNSVGIPEGSRATNSLYSAFRAWTRLKSCEIVFQKENTTNSDILQPVYVLRPAMLENLDITVKLFGRAKIMRNNPRKLEKLTDFLSKLSNLKGFRLILPTGGYTIGPLIAQLRVSCPCLENLTTNTFDFSSESYKLEFPNFAHFGCHCFSYYNNVELAGNMNPKMRKRKFIDNFMVTLRGCELILTSLEIVGNSLGDPTDFDDPPGLNLLNLKVLRFGGMENSCDGDMASLIVNASPNVTEVRIDGNFSKELINLIGERCKCLKLITFGDWNDNIPVKVLTDLVDKLWQEGIRLNDNGLTIELGCGYKCFKDFKFRNQFVFGNRPVRVRHLVFSEQ